MLHNPWLDWRVAWNLECLMEEWLPCEFSSPSIGWLVGLRWEFMKENKKKRKKTRTRPRKWSRKKESFFFFFSWSLSWPSSCFLDRFLGRVFVFLFSYFLFSFINSHLRLEPLNQLNNNVMKSIILVGQSRSTSFYYRQLIHYLKVSF